MEKKSPKAEGHISLKEIQTFFERVGIRTEPSHMIEQLLDDGNAGSEPDESDPFELAAYSDLQINDWELTGLVHHLGELDRELSDQEEQVLLLWFQWHWDDIGLARRFFDKIGGTNTIKEFYVSICKELTHSLTYLEEIIDRLKRLDSKEWNIQQFINAVSDEDVELTPSEEEELNEVLEGEIEILAAFQQALIKADEHDQARGKRKRSRKGSSRDKAPLL